MLLIKNHCTSLPVIYYVTGVMYDNFDESGKLKFGRLSGCSKQKRLESLSSGKAGHQKEPLKSPEEIHDLRIMMEYGYEFLQKQEKTEIRPEQSQVENYQMTARKTLFADD